ncbi:MAG: glycosyltransferase family 39 protein [Acidobacteriota bacterium]
MRERFQSSRLLLALAAILFIQIFYRLGGLGLTGPDEPRYAQVAREMVDSADWITPRLHGKPWFEKPILYYWLAALGYLAFGVSEFAARLGSALAGAAGACAVFWVARRVWDAQVGFWSVCVLLTSMLYFALSRAASMDALLTGTLTVALCSLALMLAEEKSPSESRTRGGDSWAWVLLYLSLGLSTLAKGPVGVLLIGTTLLLTVLLSGCWRFLKRASILKGGLLYLVVAVPWFWLCYRSNGQVFVEEFLWQHNLERFTTDRYQHAQPFWFYVPVLLIGFLPWSFQLISAGWERVRRRFRFEQKEDRVELLLWVWLGVALLFFSVSKSKLPGYILPVAPAVAILVGRHVSALMGRSPTVDLAMPGRIVVLQGITLAVAGGLLPFQAERFTWDVGSTVWIFSVLLVTGGAAGVILGMRRRFRALVLTYVACVVVLTLLVTWRLFPRLGPSVSARELAGFVAGQGYSGQPLLVLGVPRSTQYGLDFYLNTESRIVYSTDDIRRFQDREVLLVSQEDDPRLKALTPEGHRHSAVHRRFRVIRFVPH